MNTDLLSGFLTLVISGAPVVQVLLECLVKGGRWAIKTEKEKV